MPSSILFDTNVSGPSAWWGCAFPGLRPLRSGAVKVSAEISFEGIYSLAVNPVELFEKFELHEELQLTSSQMWLVFILLKIYFFMQAF